MKKQIKKWSFRLTTTGLLLAGLLLIIILNLVLAYAHKTTHQDLMIYHK